VNTVPEGGEERKKKKVRGKEGIRGAVSLPARPGRRDKEKRAKKRKGEKLVGLGKKEEEKEKVPKGGEKGRGRGLFPLPALRAQGERKKKEGLKGERRDEIVSFTPDKGKEKKKGKWGKKEGSTDPSSFFASEKGKGKVRRGGGGKMVT